MELSIEEKAKAYDEAIKRGLNYIRQTPATEMVTRQSIIEHIFPELKESEDESIRKWIIGVLSTYEHDRDLRNAAIAYLEKQGEQKPTIEMITPEESLGIDSETYNKIVDECIYSEQKPAEWSEYDEKIKELIIKASDDGCLYGYVDSEHLLDWLNSIKSRYTLYPIINKDNKVLNSIIEHFEHERNMYDDDESKEQIDEEINWLKSLRPQSRWKPSDEQMKALQEAIIEMGKSVSPCSIEEFHEIQSLYCDLKKLKEE